MRTGAFVRIVIATGLAAMTLGGCVIHTGEHKAKFSRSEDLTAPLANVTALDVATNVGTIRLEAGQVAEVRIAAEIKVRAATEERAQELAEEVRIVAEPSGETLTIKAIKPSDLGRNQLSVDFTITAPAALALDCTTNVGDIRVTGFTKRVKASTDVGTITCTGLREEIDLHTNVGDIRAEYADDAPAALQVAMATNVGSIEFAGPHGDLGGPVRPGECRLRQDRSPGHRQRVAETIHPGLSRQGRRPGESQHERRLDPDSVEWSTSGWQSPARRLTMATWVCVGPSPAFAGAGSAKGLGDAAQALDTMRINGLMGSVLAVIAHRRRTRSNEFGRATRRK